MEILSSFGSWCNGLSFGHGGGYGMGGWMPFHFGGILQLIVIGLIIYFVVRMVRRPATEGVPLSAVDILKKRYAAGEIDEETYRRMKDELQ